jgi:hypothetical protein
MDASALDGLHFRTRNGHWVLKCGTGLKTAWFIRGAWSMFWDAWLDIPPARRVIRSVFATAGLDATGDVTATAGHASLVSRGGQVTGTVRAGRSASAFALQSITGDVYAGEDAVASTLASDVGSVTAGRDALAVAGHAVSGPVTGGRHAGIVAFGPVSASVNAASGDAFVVTRGAVSNTVTAGGSAFVSAGDGASLPAASRSTGGTNLPLHVQPLRTGCRDA